MVKLHTGVAVCNREGVYHTRMRRLGTEGRRENSRPLLRIGREFFADLNKDTDQIGFVPC